MRLGLFEDSDDEVVVERYTGNAVGFKEYVDNIYLQHRSDEDNFIPDPNYMGEKQPHLKPEYRFTIVEWITNIVYNMQRQVSAGLDNANNFSTDTLYLAVYLIDRFLSKTPNLRGDKFQLVGITCLLIASKYEDIFSIKLDDVFKVSYKAYSKKEIKAMEIAILESLNYNITHAYSNTFVDYFAIKLFFTNDMKNLASAYTEMALFDYELIGYKPSLIAAAATYMALEEKSNISNDFEAIVGHQLSEILPVVSHMRVFNINHEHLMNKIKAQITFR